MAKHNKKRNVGLLHEQLVRHASEMTVDGLNEQANLAIKILVEFFNKDSELLKEFRLFSALAHPRVVSKDIAKRIIEESRRACEDHDPHKLNREKSRLIKEINYKIDRQDFYNQRVENFKVLSTIKALLNEWRGKTALSPSERVQYELVLENHLTRKPSESNLKAQKDADPLILNIMIEKFNTKYGSRLGKEQRDILESLFDDNQDALVEKTLSIKEKARQMVESYYENCDNDILISKKEFLKKRIDEFSPSSTDESITKALMLADLIKELEEKEEQ